MSWILKWESKHPYYRMEFYFRGEKEAFAYGSANKKLLGISRNNVMKCFYDEEDQRQIREKSIGVISERGKMKQYFIETHRAIRALISSLETYKTDSSDRAELKDGYKKIVLEYQKFYTSYDLSRPEYFESTEKKLKEALSEEDFIVLTTPIEITTLDREREDFLEIVISGEERKITEHQGKYGWIGASEDVHPWGIDFYREKFHLLSKEQAVEELRIKKERRQELQKRQSETAINGDEEILYLCEVVRRMAHLRLESRLNWARADRLFNEVLISLATRFDVNHEDIFYYGEKDIVSLFDGRFLDTTILSERKQAFAFRYDETAYDEYSGELSVRELEEKEGVIAVYKEVSVITGSVANKGFARGRVKVINAHTENQTAAGEEMEDGDVLVTGMTRPHLIYAIKKASAIVTDEGGITCHAAIVSREMNKPCIIGTKIATQVLHDGDLVEVDADNGVVRVIERK